MDQSKLDAVVKIVKNLYQGDSPWRGYLHKEVESGKCTEGRAKDMLVNRFTEMVQKAIMAVVPGWPKKDRIALRNAVADLFPDEKAGKLPWKNDQAGVPAP